MLLQVLGSCCAETKQAAWRGKVVSSPSGHQRPLGGSYSVTSFSDTIWQELGQIPCFHFSQSSWDNVWGGGYVLYMHIWPFEIHSQRSRQNYLYRTQIRSSLTIAFPLYLGQNPKTFSYNTLPILVPAQNDQFLFTSLFQWFVRLLSVSWIG